MFVAGQQHGTTEQRRFGEYQRIVDLLIGYQSLFANPLRDAFGDARSHRNEVRRNDAPGLAKLNCFAGRLPLLFVTPQSPVRQFMLDGGRDEKTSVAKSFSNHGNRVNDVVQTVGEVEKNIRVNGDELWRVWSRRQSKVS